MRGLAGLLLGLALGLLPGSASARAYTVKPGDTLGAIARTHGCEVDDIKKANKLDSDFLRDGQALKLPRACRKGASRGASKGAKPVKGAKPAKGGKAEKPAKGGRKKKPVLREVLAAHGFGGRRSLKVRVIEVTLDKRGRRIVDEDVYDWEDSAHDHMDWNAASTVKLFSAVGAIERLQAKGFDSRAQVTFFGQGKAQHTVQELIEASLIKSDNLAHNRLVQLAGYDFLNGRVLKNRGLKHTAIHRPYETSRWIPMTGSRTFRETPKIVLKQGRKTATLPAEQGKHGYTCPHSAACTSVADLAQAMRSLMLHEQLGPRDRFKLDKRSLRLIRDALKAERKRGMDVVNLLEKAFKPGQEPPSSYSIIGYQDEFGRPLTVSPEADRAVNQGTGGLY